MSTEYAPKKSGVNKQININKTKNNFFSVLCNVTTYKNIYIN